MAFLRAFVYLPTYLPTYLSIYVCTIDNWQTSRFNDSRVMISLLYDLILIAEGFVIVWFLFSRVLGVDLIYITYI